MLSRRKFPIFAAGVIGVLILGLLARGQIMRRAAFDSKNVMFESNYTLSETHPGNLVVAGDTITLDSTSRITGDASLIGKTIHVGGRVDGDLNLLGEDLTLDPGVQVDGDANLSGRQVTISGQVAGDLNVNGEQVTILPDAQISGDVSTCGGSIDDQRVGASQPTCLSGEIEPLAAQARTLVMIILLVLGTLALTGMSALLVTFFPRQISHIEEAMRARPRSYGGVGVAAYGLVIGVFFALILLLALLPPLGLLLIPVFLILSLLLFGLSVTGLVTLAVMLGDWVLRRTSKLPTPPLIAAVIGSILLSIGLAGITLLPFGLAISGVLFGILSSVGLGAALTTRIGTRPVGRTYFVQG